MPIPDHVRQAMLRGDYVALSRMGRRGGINRAAARKTKTEPLTPTLPKRQDPPIRDGKSAACGNDD